jgi:CheY-like chemotaxis protein
MTTLLKKRILVIDDAADVHILLRSLFESKGYAVDSTLNGQDALALLNTRVELPFLILLDAQMPVMTGYEFRELQMTNLRLKDIPVIVMSAEYDIALFEKMLRPKCILLKPLSVKSLLEAVSSI